MKHSALSLARQAIERAQAQARSVTITDPGPRHREFSKLFVEAMAGLLGASHADGETRFCLSKHNEHAGHYKTHFGLNELLYDVAVVETAEARAPNGQGLKFVTKALWAVESELARDTRQAIYDFNKLVLARADQLLFVGPLVADNEAFISTLAEPAQHCLGELSLALVPHPDKWGSQGPSEVMAWSWSGSEWVEQS